MNTVKFRAWHRETKGMHYTPDIQLIALKEAITRPDRKDILKIWELMQFTGLKDKTGKEIYEGDIVKEFFGAYWLIVWNEDYLHWAFKTVREAPKSGNFIDTSDMKSPKRLLNRSEVIGNIYENPELIQKQ